MLKEVEALVKKVSVFTPNSKEELDLFRLEYLGKKGVLNTLFDSFKEIPKEEKKSLDKL